MPITYIVNHYTSISSACRQQHKLKIIKQPLHQHTLTAFIVNDYTFISSDYPQADETFEMTNFSVTVDHVYCSKDWKIDRDKANTCICKL
jgi:hypothetical protein